MKISLKKPFKKVRLFFKTKVAKVIFIVLCVGVVLGALYLGKAYFVAAVVDGKPITRIAVLGSLEKQDGKAVLDSLVEKELILNGNNFINIDNEKYNISSSGHVCM